MPQPLGPVKRAATGQACIRGLCTLLPGRVCCVCFELFSLRTNEAVAATVGERESAVAKQRLASQADGELVRIDVVGPFHCARQWQALG